MTSLFTENMTLLVTDYSRTIKAQITNNLIANNNAMPAWASSVVKIWYECNGTTYTGAGVIVSNSGYILTASHVGRDCSGISSTSIQIGVVSSAYIQPQPKYTATLIDQITDNAGNPNVYDLKLLKIDTTGGIKLTSAAYATTLPFPGDDIFVAGFPDLPFTFLSQKQASLSVYKTNVFSCFAEAGNNIPTRIHYGGNSLPGFSGGPIFDKTGHLIGIHSTRSTANITNLLTTPCGDSANTQNPCWGNAVRFQLLTKDNRLVTQEVNINYNALKNVLDNYSWGTSIWRIPQQWLKMMQ
jgi:Trypsin-like peptidase domain